MILRECLKKEYVFSLGEFMAGHLHWIALEGYQTFQLSNNCQVPKDAIFRQCLVAYV